MTSDEQLDVPRTPKFTGDLAASTRVSMEVNVTIVSWFITSLGIFRGFTTYLYRGYNPFTEYHGHPSREIF